MNGQIGKVTTVSLPELGLIAGTRALIGAGLGLLLSSRLQSAPRKAVGWSLLIVGVLSTIPLAIEVLSHRVSQEQVNG